MFLSRPLSGDCRKQSNKVKKKFRCVLVNSLHWLILSRNIKNLWSPEFQKWRVISQKLLLLYRMLTRVPCLHNSVLLSMQISNLRKHKVGRKVCPLLIRTLSLLTAFIYFWYKHLCVFNLFLCIQSLLLGSMSNWCYSSTFSLYEFSLV